MSGASHEHDRRFVVENDRKDDGRIQHLAQFWRRRTQTHNARVARGSFVACALALALAVKFIVLPPAWIEAHYSNGVYPVIDRCVRALTGRVPFCVADLLVVFALAWLARLWALGVRRRALATPALETLATACVVYVWFAGSWALNYGRIPLADKIPVRADAVRRAAVDALGDRVVVELSRYARAAHGERLDDAHAGRLLIPTFDAVTQRLGNRARFAPPRIKPTFFQPALALSGTTGFTDPWTHEVNLDSTTLAVERPAIYAHEWAHLAGFADESEANFIAVLACTTSRDPLLAYSGWILVWFNLPPDVHLTRKLSRLAYADLIAIRAHYARHVNVRLQRATQSAYDAYLKSNRVEAGYASYRLFIRWLTGAEFDRAGLPRVNAV